MKTKHRTLKKYLVKLLKYIFSQTNKCLQMNYTNYTNWIENDKALLTMLDVTLKLLKAWRVSQSVRATYI